MLRTMREQKVKHLVQQTRSVMPSAIAFLCAVFILCVIPLFYDQAFFNINRAKVKLILRIVPPLGVLMLFSLIASRKKKARLHPICLARFPVICLTLFFLACVISCGMQRFSQAVLIGDKGRYGGLWFLCCCITAFFILAFGRLSGRILVPLVLTTASACALLGFANVMGRDPLGFYARIRAGQEIMFLSTVGHFDFFGTFMVMVFGLAGGQFVFCKMRGGRVFAAVCSVAIILGAFSSRTDSALLGMHLVCLGLTACAGGQLYEMFRACILWSAVFFMLPIVYGATQRSLFSIQWNGFPALLATTHFSALLGCVMLVVGVWILRIKRKHIKAPGQKKTLRAALWVALFGVVFLSSLIFYFTFVNPNAEIGSTASLLRFDDYWGSMRGYLYRGAFNAYADFSRFERLFGRGLEMSAEILAPYTSDPTYTKLAGGIYNDAHNQALQYLLTCGLFGSLSFCGFYVSMFATVCKHMRDDALLCGIFGSLCGYSVILLLNVAQPILIATYFSLCGLAISHICYREQKEGIR